MPSAAASGPTTSAASPAVPGGVDTAAKPSADNAGKPGYYTIKPGDTLIRVGLETGQNARDIARWNNIENPNSLEVGQVIRVAPPGVDPPPPRRAASTARASSRVRSMPSRPRPPRPWARRRQPAAHRRRAAVSAGRRSTAASGRRHPAAEQPANARDPDDEVSWTWPAAGPVIAGFDEAKTKGLVISGKAGDPVLAAADGRVVYAGSGLRGYGNLVIVKHNNTYLTAYAHNQALLVKEDQVVRRGQKIAEMGSSDAERVQLHFEIRRQGRPIDPARLLPPR